MIADNIQKIKKNLPKEVTLVAVSKTKSVNAILEAYDAGQLDFGENKVQELSQKALELPKNIRWHMIGHLQRNKVKYIAPFVHLIHGVDSARLLNEINKQAVRNNRIIDVLIQIHIAEESSKFGFSFQEAETLLTQNESYQGVRIAGLMGMATFTNDENQIQKEFNALADFYATWKVKQSFSVLSMGMSNDFALAVNAGSTMVRIGSLIFGSRN